MEAMVLPFVFVFVMMTRDGVGDMDCNVYIAVACERVCMQSVKR